MVFYNVIAPNTIEGKCTINRLLQLRKKPQKEIPEKKLDSNLLLATWNTREFDSRKNRERRDGTLDYIAETISKSDIVTIHEVRKDLQHSESAGVYS